MKMKLLKKIKFIISWFKRLGLWILLAKYYLLAFIIPIVTIFYLIYYGKFEPKLISSIFLISGLLIMVSQFISDVAQFAKEHPKSFRNVMKAFPNLNLRVINLNPLPAHISDGHSPHLEIGLSQNATIDEKINFIFGELDTVKSEQRKLEKLMRNNQSEVNGNIKELEDLFRKKMSLLNSTIAGHVVGSFDKNILSVILTTCGIIIQWLT